ALQAAGRLSHQMICPEHLMLALLELQGDESERFLTGQGIRSAEFEEKIRVAVGSGGEAPPLLPCLSLRALGAVRLSEDTASLHRRSWSPLYLLWSIVQDGDSDASLVLRAMGADLESWTAALEERIGEPTRRRPGIYTLAGGDTTGHRAEFQHWRQRLRGAEDFLNEKVIGQPQAVERVYQALVRAWAGMKEGGRPLASLLLVGPSGSGKTTLANSLAEFLYNDSRRCIRFDMNTYTEGERLYSLIGGPTPGDEGLLTRINREYPHSILVFEDAHRSHPRIQNLLAEIIATGQSIDMRGNRLEFRESIIIVYINVDSELLNSGAQLGFRRGSEAVRWIKAEESLLPQLETALGPEMMGHVDDVVFFRALQTPELVLLLKQWSEELRRRLSQRRGVKISVNEEVLQSLAKRAQDFGKGAGVLHRLFVREVENRLGEAMLEGLIEEGDSAVL
ncbi:unnamed protein product, partial [Phaeothamnion confervicola]